jgi:hypothetical protein
VELEIEPEPTPQERVAIAKAIAAVEALVRPRDRGSWWRSGVAATLGSDEATGGERLAPAERRPR